MPNYCNNNIVITGPNSVIDKIEKIANGDKGDLLQYFYPMPKELNDTVAGPEPKTKKEKLEKQKWIFTKTFLKSNLNTIFMMTTR